MHECMVECRPGKTGVVVLRRFGAASWMLLPGVLTTHGTVQHQIQALHAAWRWTPHDVIVNVLPLHHIHGVLNVVLSAAAIGATVEMCTGFDPTYTFDRSAADCAICMLAASPAAW